MSAVLKETPRLLVMTQDDLDEVLAIENVIYTHPWTRGNFGDSLRAGYDCWTWRLDGELVGGIRFTALTIGGEGRALLLGPLVVHPAYNGKGFGKALVGEGIERARAQGFRLVVLVGDMPYYGRFGFVQVPRGQITLPGPVDPARLLALELVPGALADACGLVQAKVA